MLVAIIRFPPMMKARLFSMTIALFSFCWYFCFILRTVEAYCPVVICPGFGNDSIDYDTPLQQSSDVGLVSVLGRRGFDKSLIYTVPVKRTDWIRVGLGLLDVPDFYLGKAKPTGLGYNWYVQRLKETVDKAYDESGGEKVLLIGHSAGGWLARAAMGDGLWSSSSSSTTYDDDDDDGNNGDNNNNNKNSIKTSDRIRCLATLGAIHSTPEGKYESTCVTRGALKYTDENYPGAFLKERFGIGYVSVGGAAIIGDDTKDEKSEDENTNNKPNEEDDDDEKISSSEIDNLYKKRGEGNSKRVAFTSYKAVSGNGNLIGDGVVPLQWTQLDGAKQIELNDVVHSINEAGTTIPTDRWYGSENVIDRWLPTVMEEAKLKNKQAGGGGLLSQNFDLDKVLPQWASNFVRR